MGREEGGWQMTEGNEVVAGGFEKGKLAWHRCQDEWSEGLQDAVKSVGGRRGDQRLIRCIRGKGRVCTLREVEVSK